jgi:hypothetical protein
MTIPTRDYIELRAAQINAALSANEPAAVAATLDLIRADGHHDLAAEIQRDLTEQALNQLVQRAAR